MDYNEREFHISRILAVRQQIKIGRNYYFLYSNSCQERYNANLLFRRILEAAIKNGAATTDDVLNLLIDNNLWNIEDESLLDKVPKDIEQLKVELYQSATTFQSNKEVQIRGYLKEARSILDKLSRRRNQFEMYGATGIATISKMQYLIGRALRDKGGKRIADGRIIGTAVYKYNSLLLEETEYRELARTDPWRNLWCISKGNKLFRGLNSELTDEQRILVSWSRIYDNVYKHHETPDEVIIADDDLLDGWFIVQKREREKESHRRRADELSEKHGNAQEVFIPAQTLEDAKRVNDLNDAHGKIIKRQRFNQLRQSSGSLNHSEMADVRQQMQMQTTQAAHNK